MPFLERHSNYANILIKTNIEIFSKQRNEQQKDQSLLSRFDCDHSHSNHHGICFVTRVPLIRDLIARFVPLRTVRCLFDQILSFGKFIQKYTPGYLSKFKDEFLHCL